MPRLDDFELPNTQDPIERLDWATERMWDIAEGKLAPAHAGILWAIVVGWADLATPEERQAFFGIAARIQELQQALLER